jgi:spoIIIJ-associated protein
VTTGDTVPEHTVEATGETVGEAKWQALRELERLAPGLDKSAVRFEVVSEGERGLLGIGYAPARVIAAVRVSAAPADSPAPNAEESAEAADLRVLLSKIVEALGVHCRVDVSEDDETVNGVLAGDDLGLVIGRHGQTIDAIQYLANAISYRAHGDDRKDVVVDAAGYRERRRETLEAMAIRSADRARSKGDAVELEPMSSIERRIIHLRLQDEPGVATRSEGEEPHRYVVVEPA